LFYIFAVSQIVVPFSVSGGNFKYQLV